MKSSERTFQSEFDEAQSNTKVTHCPASRFPNPPNTNARGLLEYTDNEQILYSINNMAHMPEAESLIGTSCEVDIRIGQRAAPEFHKIPARSSIRS